MRTLLALTLALGLASAASAQTTFGLRAGLNVSDLTGFDEGELDGAESQPSLGLVAGAFAELPLSERIAVRPEVLYSQKGFKVTERETFEGSVAELEVDYNLDYVEVPILLRVGTPLSPTLDAGLLIGPALAFKVNESFDIDATVDGVEVELEEEDIDLDGDVFESFDLGLAVGAEIGSGPFYVGLRYTPGLLDVNKNEEDDPSAPTIRNSVFSVTGTFKFGR